MKHLIDQSLQFGQSFFVHAFIQKIPFVERFKFWRISVRVAHPNIFHDQCIVIDIFGIV